MITCFYCDKTVRLKNGLVCVDTDHNLDYINNRYYLFDYKMNGRILLTLLSTDFIKWKCSKPKIEIINPNKNSINKLMKTISLLQ